MFTILSTPKAFTGLFAIIQRNALESWTRLEPRPEFFLFGRDAGTAEVCAEFGLRHVPDVATNVQQVAERGHLALPDDDVTRVARAAAQIARGMIIGDYPGIDDALQALGKGWHRLACLAEFQAA